MYQPVEAKGLNWAGLQSLYYLRNKNAEKYRGFFAFVLFLYLRTHPQRWSGHGANINLQIF